jgi:hypothetical protein
MKSVPPVKHPAYDGHELYLSGKVVQHEKCEQRNLQPSQLEHLGCARAKAWNSIRSAEPSRESPLKTTLAQKNIQQRRNPPYCAGLFSVDGV